MDTFVRKILEWFDDAFDVDGQLMDRPGPVLSHSNCLSTSKSRMAIGWILSYPIRSTCQYDQNPKFFSRKKYLFFLKKISLEPKFCILIVFYHFWHWETNIRLFSLIKINTKYSPLLLIWVIRNQILESLKSSFGQNRTGATYPSSDPIAIFNSKLCRINKNHDTGDERVHIFGGINLDF